MGCGASKNGTGNSATKYATPPDDNTNNNNTSPTTKKSRKSHRDLIAEMMAKEARETTYHDIMFNALQSSVRCLDFSVMTLSLYSAKTVAETIESQPGGVVSVMSNMSSAASGMHRLVLSVEEMEDQGTAEHRTSKSGSVGGTGGSNKAMSRPNTTGQAITLSTATDDPCRGCALVCDSALETVRSHTKSVIQMISALNADTESASLLGKHLRDLHAIQKLISSSCGNLSLIMNVAKENIGVEARAEKQTLDELMLRQKQIHEAVKQRQENAIAQLWHDAERRKIGAKELRTIRAAFDKFDPTGSGFIEVNKLRALVWSLGCELDDITFDVADGDADDDKKLSFEQFTEWWSGSKDLGGNRGVMLSLIKVRLQIKAAFEKMSKTFEKAPGKHGMVLPSHATNSNNNKSTFDVRLRTADAFSPQTSVDVVATPMAPGQFDETMKTWDLGYMSQSTVRKLTSGGIESGHPAGLAMCITFVSSETDETTVEILCKQIQEEVINAIAFPPSEGGGEGVGDVRAALHIVPAEPGDFITETQLRLYVQISRAFANVDETVQMVSAQCAGVSDVRSFDPRTVFETLSVGIATEVDVISQLNISAHVKNNNIKEINPAATKVIDILNNFTLSVNGTFKTSFLESVATLVVIASMRGKNDSENSFLERLQQNLSDAAPILSVLCAPCGKLNAVVDNVTTSINTAAKSFVHATHMQLSSMEPKDREAFVRTNIDYLSDTETAREALETFFVEHFSEMALGSVSDMTMGNVLHNALEALGLGGWLRRSRPDDTTTNNNVDDEDAVVKALKNVHTTLSLLCSRVESVVCFCPYVRVDVTVKPQPGSAEINPCVMLPTPGMLESSAAALRSFFMSTSQRRPKTARPERKRYLDNLESLHAALNAMNMRFQRF
eukprot:PhM_4_TR14119/c0_g1_i2/m.43068